MSINNINVLTLSNNRLELFDFINRGSSLKLNRAFTLPVNDIVDVTEGELGALNDIGINGKYFIIVDCSYESLKNIFVFNKEITDIRNKTINSFKDKYEVKLTDYYIDLRIQNFENYIISYVTASPKIYVDLIADFLKKNGGRLLCMESDIDSLNRFEPVKNTVYLHIHVKNRNSLALVSKDKKIISERLITFGYKDMLEILSRSGGVLLEDAKAMLEKKGISDEIPESEEDRNYQNAAMDVLDKISVEIQKSLDLFQQNVKEKMPELIVISGKLKNIPGAERYYSKLFNTEVKRFNILGFVESEIKGIDFSDDFDNLEIATGAGMRRKF